MKRGQFIVFEGIDNSGKSTQLNMFCKYLEDHQKRVKCIAYPNYESIIGKCIKECLIKGDLEPHAQHLLFSANRWEQNNQVKEWLKEYDYVLCDRYIWSGIAYTVLPLDDAKHADRGLLIPDHVIFMDISVETSISRPGFCEKEHNKQLETKEKQQHAVLRYILLKNFTWTQLDGSKNADEIHKELINKLSLF